MKSAIPRRASEMTLPPERDKNKVKMASRKDVREMGLLSIGRTAASDVRCAARNLRRQRF